MKNRLVLTLSILLLLIGCKQQRQNKAQTIYSEGVDLSLQAGKLMIDREEQEAKQTLNQAIEKFDQALKLDPEHPTAESSAAFAFYQLRIFKLAEIRYKRAIQQNPDLALNYQYLGLCQANLDRIEEARTNFDKAFELDKTGEVKAGTIKELGQIAQTAFASGQEDYKSFAIGILLIAWEYSPNDAQTRALLREFGDKMGDAKLMEWLDSEGIK